MRPTRSLARERALQYLYQLEGSGGQTLTDPAAFWTHFFPEDKPPAYFFRLVEGISRQREILDAYITRYAEHWRLERMASIDRNILRLAIFELLSCPEVPPKVAVNEAIELAKKYGSEHSGAFVNGILDNFVRAATAGKAASKPAA